MSRINKFLSFSLLALVLTVIISCAGTKKGTSISGNIEGANGLSVFFDEIDPSSKSKTIQSGQTGADGSFSFDFPEGVNPGFYQVKVGAKGADVILDGTEKTVSLNGKLSGLDRYDYTVSGSKATEDFLSTINAYKNKEMSPKDVSAYIENTASPLTAAALSLRMFGFRAESVEMHKKVLAKLEGQYPDVHLLNGYKTQLNNSEKQALRRQAQEKIKVGEIAPEIALPNPDGKTIKLSDYKGKVVLLDFWASWCGPCRKANPHVVDIYNKYKAKGFDVFSVSLDGVDQRTASRMNGDQERLESFKKGQKDRWLKAISKDGLIWDGHVSDLRKWDCAPAKEYGVRSIPRTFLIDREGKIAAINPRYDLEEQIKKVL